MRAFLIISLLFFSAGISAQKRIHKTLKNPRTSWVHIDAENCFLLKLANSDSEEVIVEARIDGEYQEFTQVEMEQEGSTLTIRPGFRPDFRHPNDKLSAHKVISNFLVVFVPKYTNVKIYGLHTQVDVRGIYSQTEIILDDGQCSMNLVAEKLHAVTQSGDIYFESKGARVKAESQYGTVKGGPIRSGNGSVSLRSTSGNIYLKQGD